MSALAVIKGSKIQCKKSPRHANDCEAVNQHLGASS